MTFFLSFEEHQFTSQVLYDLRTALFLPDRQVEVEDLRCLGSSL